MHSPSLARALADPAALGGPSLRSVGDNGVMDDSQFRADLYRGTASYYDRFRVPYPQSLFDDLAERSGAGSQGSLLDLACGPGLISFAMHGRFREVWAVDQEPGMIDVARQGRGK